MKRRRWQVTKLGDMWLVRPLGEFNWRELSVWRLWENALSHAQLMADADRMEPTA